MYPLYLNNTQNVQIPHLVLKNHVLEHLSTRYESRMDNVLRFLDLFTRFNTFLQQHKNRNNLVCDLYGQQQKTSKVDSVQSPISQPLAITLR